MEDILDKQYAAYKPLTLKDRCDRCGESSQAFVRVIKNDKELIFCGHHFSRYEPVLVADGWLVQDERNMINSKPMSGVPALNEE